MERTSRSFGSHCHPTAINVGFQEHPRTIATTPRGTTRALHLNVCSLLREHHVQKTHHLYRRGVDLHRTISMHAEEARYAYRKDVAMRTLEIPDEIGRKFEKLQMTNERKEIGMCSLTFGRQHCDRSADSAAAARVSVTIHHLQ